MAETRRPKPGQAAPNRLIKSRAPLGAAHQLNGTDMANIESLLGHRIKQSTELIARVRPLLESVVTAAQKREIGDPVVVLADSMRWRRRLLVSLAELDDSAERLDLFGVSDT